MIYNCSKALRHIIYIRGVNHFSQRKITPYIYDMDLLNISYKLLNYGLGKTENNHIPFKAWENQIERTNIHINDLSWALNYR